MGVLDSRVAIVTGGAGNLGSYVCRLFVAQGASVVINDVNAEKVQAGAHWSLGPSTSTAPSTRWHCWPGGYR